MMQNKKRGFFERLTGSIKMEEDLEDSKRIPVKSEKKENWLEEESEEAELTVDVYQTPSEIIVQTMVAGVRPEDLELTISRDMVSIRGKREESRTINEENFFTKELYWGEIGRAHV